MIISICFFKNSGYAYAELTEKFNSVYRNFDTLSSGLDLHTTHSHDEGLIPGL